MELISYTFELIASNLPVTILIIVAVGFFHSVRGCFDFGV